MAPRLSWWRQAVVYQVYLRSFADGNGDGIGDIAGLRSRLPYIKSLGVDAIWINPWYVSPMSDGGYDVADYRAIDPSFGTMEDAEGLVSEARRLGIRVLLDLVPNHTSSEHPWFQEALASGRDSPARDRYHFRPGRGRDWSRPPTNWASIFGGPAWEWDGVRRQYYMHNFLTSQPDLNFHNRAVQRAVLDTMKFWLDRGVDGFRLDTVNFYFHDKHLRDNPPLDSHLAGGTADAPDTNPYAMQHHLYDKTQPENVDFMRRIRALLDEYDARATVGESRDEGRAGVRVVRHGRAGELEDACGADRARFGVRRVEQHLNLVTHVAA